MENIFLFTAGIILGAFLTLGLACHIASMHNNMDVLTGGKTIAIVCHKESNGCSILTKFKNQESKWIWIKANKNSGITPVKPSAEKN